MKAQFSSGLRFLSFEVNEDNVKFLPDDRWEFTGSGKWVKNIEREFIVQGPTKKGAQAIDYTQKIRLIVVDKATNDKVFDRYRRFFPDSKIEGQRIDPPRNPTRRRRKSKTSAPDNFDLLKMEYERACGSFRQSIRLATLCMEETTCDQSVYREAATKIQELLLHASLISELIFSCPPLHYLCAKDTANWTNGTLYGVRFSNRIKATAQLFVLCHQGGKEKYTALFDLKLERSGQWTTPGFTGVNNMKYPQVSHSDFCKAIMWLVNFTSRDIYRLADYPLFLFDRSHPDIDRRTMDGRLEEEAIEQ